MRELNIQPIIDAIGATAPWRDSHLGAGVYAALVNSDEITAEFSENYFEWYRDNADPVTGFWKKGVADKAPLVGHTNSARRTKRF